MDILKMALGKFGRWHFFLYLLVCCYGFCVAFHLLSMEFLAPTLDYWCTKPENFQNVSDKTWQNLSMIVEDDKMGGTKISKCKMYDLPYENMTEMELMDLPRTDVKPIKCKSWTYDTSFYAHTLIDKWDLVCDRDFMISTANSVGMIGLLFGVFIMGQLSDRFGRRPVVLAGTGIWILASAVTPFCEFYALFVILRFIILAVAIGSFTNAFVILAECISDYERATWGNAKGFGFAVGFMTLAGLGYWIRTWQYLQIAVTIPVVLLFIACYFWLPESPRWLLVNGRLQECTKVIQKIIEMNKLDASEVDLGETLLDSYEKSHHLKTDDNKKTFLDLIKTPKLRLISLNMFFAWFVTSFVYYAQSMSAGDLGGNPFINFFISGAVEVPAILVIIFATIKCGRKKSFMFLTFIGGLGCFLTIPVPNHMTWLRVTFAMIGKFGMSANFPLIYVYASEVFPTPVRNVGVGSSSMCARVGTALSPYVKEIAILTNKHVPQGIAGTLAMICLVLAWFLPETSNRKLPETIEEIEHPNSDAEDEEEMKIPEN